MKRTLDNCRLIKKHGYPEQNKAMGTCMGFGRGEYDDEPCETCKKCPLQESNVYEREAPND